MKKNLFGTPKQIDNSCPGGHCDNCGKDLGSKIWREYEHTGCTKKCVLELIRLEQLDLEQDNPALKPGVDYVDRFGDEA